MPASSRRSPSGSAASSPRSTSTSLSTISCCARTDTSSPAAIENAPASRPATPARRTADALVDAPATPSTSDRLVSNPSPAPSTVARVVPPWTSRWRLALDLPKLSQRPTDAAGRAGGFSFAVLICEPPAMRSTKYELSVLQFLTLPGCGAILRAGGAEQQAELGGGGGGPGGGIEEPVRPAGQFDLHLPPRDRGPPGIRVGPAFRLAAVLIWERTGHLVVGDLSQHLPGGIYQVPHRAGGLQPGDGAQPLAAGLLRHQVGQLGRHALGARPERRVHFAAGAGPRRELEMPPGVGPAGAPAQRDPRRRQALPGGVVIDGGQMVGARAGDGRDAGHHGQVGHHEASIDGVFALDLDGAIGGAHTPTLRRGREDASISRCNLAAVTAP